ncbi:MAG: carboxypeptidase-like regulatory domain-containing protein [Thermoanaerobaculales bacterium]|nr:carboxypeptidase-like regulatory domain-containing protein [Thermoanaerobaculales bacterium]
MNLETSIFRSVASSAVFALTFLYSSPHAIAQTILWCEDSERIEVESCLEERPEEGAYLPLRIEEGCIGEVGIEEGSPECVMSRLVDPWGQPVTVECEITMEAGDHEVHLTSRFKNGELLVPEWASSLLVECDRTADARLDGQEPPSKVLLVPGRTVIVQTTLERYDGEKTPKEVTLDLTRLGMSLRFKQELKPGTEVDLGSFPLGAYDLHVSGKGIASIVDFFYLRTSEHPLMLKYDLETGRCVELPILCRACQHPVLRHRVERTNSSMGPVTQSEGPLPLKNVGNDLFMTKLCGLPTGTYDLTVESNTFQPLSVEFTLTNSDLGLDQVELRYGVAGKVFVYDEVGLPITGAETIVRWRKGEDRGSTTVQSDSEGGALLPALETNTPISLWVGSEGFVGQRVRGFAGSDVFVNLAEAGRITGRVVAEACDLGTVVVELTQCQGSNCKVRAPSLSEAIPDCVLDLQIDSPGHYQVSVRAPDTEPFSEELDLKDELSHDFGTITLERGSELTVVVSHQQNPVPGATVSLVGRCPSKASDESGMVTFACLDEDVDEVDIQVRHPEFAFARLTANIVSPDQEVRVNLVKGARIYGLVFNDDGTPASGTELQAKGEGDRRTARVGPDGRYAFDKIAPGQWRLYLVQASRNVASIGNDRMVQVEDGGEIEVNFLPELEVAGRVSLDGTPLVDSILAAMKTSSGGGSGSGVRGIKVGPDGVFRALFPAEGLWTFHSPRSRNPVTVNLENCPCLIDLNFVSEAAPEP